jgi:hypothetical protein
MSIQPSPARPRGLHGLHALEGEPVEIAADLACLHGSLDGAPHIAQGLSCHGLREQTGGQPDLGALTQAFPQTLHGRRDLFAPAEDAQGDLERTGHRRHFLDPEHLVHLADGSPWAVTNQWGADNIAPFIARARDLGFQVTEVSR